MPWFPTVVAEGPFFKCLGVVFLVYLGLFEVEIRMPFPFAHTACYVFPEVLGWVSCPVTQVTIDSLPAEICCMIWTATGFTLGGLVVGPSSVLFA